MIKVWGINMLGIWDWLQSCKMDKCLSAGNNISAREHSLCRASLCHGNGQYKTNINLRERNVNGMHQLIKL